MQALLAAGADVAAADNCGRTPLHTAVMTEASAEVVECLLAAGASVAATDKGGRTPLHMATTPQVLHLLLAAGAILEARDHRDITPVLDRSAGPWLCPEYGLLEAFAAAGANMNVMDEYGWSCLHYCTLGHPLQSLPEQLHNMLGAGASVLWASDQYPTHLDVLLFYRPRELYEQLDARRGKTAIVQAIRLVKAGCWEQEGKAGLRCRHALSPFTGCPSGSMHGTKSRCVQLLAPQSRC